MIKQQSASSYLWPYCGLIMIGLTLPSDGNHGLLSPKSLLFLLTLSSVVWLFISRKKITDFQLKLITFTLCFLSTLLFWLLTAYVYNTNGNLKTPIDQMKIFVITLGFVMTTLYFISEKITSPQQVLRVIIFSNFAYSSAKLILFLLHFMHLINLWSFLKLIGIRLMTMNIFGEIARFQTSVDIITPFLLFFALQNEKLSLKLNPYFKAIYCLISMLSILLSFSRFLLFVSVISFFLYWSTLGALRALKGITIFTACLLLGVMVIGIENVSHSINQRFFSRDSFSSDLVRFQQVQALLQEHNQSPCFGKGLGGYARDCIRDPDLRYSYEVQWTSFLMQFGFFGIFLLMIPLMIIAWHIVKGGWDRTRVATLILFIVWILSGFTNPFLISLTSGIIYSIFILSSFALDTDRAKDTILEHSS